MSFELSVMNDLRVGIIIAFVINLAELTKLKIMSVDFLAAANQWDLAAQRLIQIFP